MRKVAIVGIGMTEFGQLWNHNLADMASQAIVSAIDDSGLDNKSIQSLFIGTMSSGLFTNQEHISSMIADHSSLKNIPSTRVEAACASGGLSLRQSYLDVASGLHDISIASGVEKMTDMSNVSATNTLSTAADNEKESALGATFPGLYAMIAKLHMHRFNTTEEQMALVSVKNHKNAIHNPNAQFKKKLSVEDVLNSPMVADPLKLLDCSPISDGAAALVLASEEKARQITDTPIWIRGSGHATDSISLHDREDLLTLNATRKAAEQAFSQAKLERDEIEVMESHDCFTIAELLALEDLGFVKKGDSGKFTQEGQTEIGAKLPVNTSGGLKAKGHPTGASGIAQAVEATLQLRGDAGKRNTDAETALTHNVGGSGGTSVVHIFSR